MYVAGHRRRPGFPHGTDTRWPASSARSTWSEPPVFYYDGDADLLLLSRHRDRLRESFRFVVANADLVETLVDKARFQDLAERLELPVPPARRLSTTNEPPGAIDLRFPVVVKPLTRQGPRWRPLTDTKAIHVESPAAIDALWVRLAE